VIGVKTGRFISIVKLDVFSCRVNIIVSCKSSAYAFHLITRPVAAFNPANLYPFQLVTVISMYDQCRLSVDKVKIRLSSYC